MSRSFEGFSSEESVHLKRTINLKLQALEKISIQVQHTMVGILYPRCCNGNIQW